MLKHCKQEFDVEHVHTIIYFIYVYKYNEIILANGTI